MGPLERRNLVVGSALLLAAILRERGGQPEPAASRPSVRGMVRHAASIWLMPAEAIMGRSRKRHVVNVRRAVAMTAREWPLSYPQIASALEGRDHSTIIHSVVTGHELAKRDANFAWLAERLFCAAECEPLGPGRGIAAAPVPVPRGVMAPDAEPVMIAAPPPAADGDEADDDQERSYCAIGWGSEMLLRAIRREHPERVPARAGPGQRSRTVRAGYAALGAA